MGAPAIFEKPIEIKLSHPASTLESRIQVKDKRSIPAGRCRDAVQFSKPDNGRSNAEAGCAAPAVGGCPVSPPLSRAGTKRWTSGGLLEELAAVFPNNTYAATVKPAGHLTMRFI
jgi:hypothetical protein